MNLKTINSDICKLLSKGYFAQAKDRINNTNVDINQTDENKRTPLILCSFIDDKCWAISVSQLLLELGADIDKSDIYQMNILHYCTILDQVDLLKFLLESIDFNINKGDCHGNTPLIYAAAVGNEAVIDLLLIYYQRFKIDINKCNHQGINAFMQACLRGNLDLMTKLESMDLNTNIKDSNGKSVLMYKEDALAKSDLNVQVSMIRRQSRMVRFDDIESILKLQQESINLKSNSKKLPEFSDKNFERINQIKSNIKTIKQNKIDKYYIYRNLKNLNNISETIFLNNNLKVVKLRPQTAFSSSQTLLNQNDWYSFLGPMCTSLEQKYSPSFKTFMKTDSQNNDSNDYMTEKMKGKQRKLSRSFGTLSRRNSISSRMVSNDDTSDSGFSTNKSKKKLEAIVSAKTISRSFGKINTNVSP